MARCAMRIRFGLVSSTILMRRRRSVSNGYEMDTSRRKRALIS